MSDSMRPDKPWWLLTWAFAGATMRLGIGFAAAKAGEVVFESEGLFWVVMTFGALGAAVHLFKMAALERDSQV